MKVLIIEDEPSVSFFLKEVAIGAGHDVRVIDDGSEAIKAYQQYAPDLIISDILLPGGKDGLEILAEIRETDRDVIFIMMTGQGSEEFAMKALELKAHNYIQKPIRFELISTLLEKYSAQIHTRSVRREVNRMVVNRSVILELDNRLDRVNDVVEYLVGEVSPWLDGEEVFSVQLGLYELIVNAIEHGNLEINYEEKNSALYDSPQKYSELIKQRLGTPELANRRITVEFKFDDGRLEWTITDGGKGFNWYNLPNPLAEENCEKLNGRGIFLAKIQFDELTFLGKGNKVRVVKNCIPRLDMQTPLPGEKTRHIKTTVD